MNQQTRLSTALVTALALSIPLSTATACNPVGAGIKKHDKLIELSVEADEALANLDAQYQRRADLLPNAVKIVKARAASEKDTLAEVTKARASATQVTLDASVMKDPEALAAYQASQQQIAQSFGKLMEIHEKYPKIKSDEGWQQLMTQLEGTENRILIGRKKYNAAVAAYNKELMIVTGKALDMITGDDMFQPKVGYKAQAGAEKAPDLDI